MSPTCSDGAIVVMTGSGVGTPYLASSITETNGVKDLQKDSLKFYTLLEMLHIQLQSENINLMLHWEIECETQARYSFFMSLFLNEFLISSK